MPPAARTPPFAIAPALGLLAGALACLRLPWLAPWPLSLALLAVGVALWRQPHRWRWVGATVAGFALAGLHAAYALSLHLPPSWDRTDATLIATVVDLPVHEPRRTRFHVRIESIYGARPEGLAPGRTLRLAWYEADAATGGPLRRHALRAGERWRFAVRVRAPRGLRNPGGVDAEQHALAQRLTGTGYLADPGSARRLAPARGLAAWRETVSDRIAARVPGQGARFVRALALGDTRGLDDADWNTLRANGLTHLVAISGFHVGLVAGFFALLARGLWWLLPGWGRRVPAPVGAAGAAVIGAVVYAAVAGFALPTLRTALMIAVVAGARMARRPLRIAESLALAAVAIVLVDPLALLSAGFWLSFAGVAWLVWCLPHGPARPLRDFLSAQGVATIGLLPVGVVMFGEASLAGPLANLVAVPWWSLVVVPLALVGTGLEAVADGAGVWAWRASGWAFERSWPLFERLGDSPLALWWLPEPRWFALPMALLGAFWLLLPRGVPAKWLAPLLWLPLLLPDRRLPSQGEVALDVIDVGQGLSVLVRTSRHALLYDMGPAIEEGFDAGERAVVPALRARGVRRLDRAVVSHGDNDHAGGWEAVRAALPVGRVETPPGAPTASAAPCRAGDGWQWDGVRFRYLHPADHFPYLRNESSCVLRIDSAYGSVLLTGDIGDVIEQRLLARSAADVRADVMLVAHHGSSGSSSAEWVAATGARFALVASGFGNRFGHPRAEVVDRWIRAGAQVHDTATSGAITVRLQPGGPAIETRRAAQPRLWDAGRR